MARSVYFLTAVAAALTVISQANALQLTNRDTAEHKISLTEPAGTQDVQIKPSQVIDGICKAGCTMKMTDGEEYEFDGNEVVSIEEGLMFLDEPAEGSSIGTSGPDDAIPSADADQKAAAPDQKAAAPDQKVVVPEPPSAEKK